MFLQKDQAHYLDYVPKADTSLLEKCNELTHSTSLRTASLHYYHAPSGKIGLLTVYILDSKNIATF